MQIVVIGATGFLGRAVCAELDRRGLAHVQVSRRRNFRSVNSVNVESYTSMPPNLKNSVLIHVAGPNNLSQNSESEITQSVAQAKALSEFGFKKIVYASSAVVYGDRLDQPASEQTQTDSRADYSKMKLLSEGVLDLNRDVVARLANLYGAGMPTFNVLSDILKQIPSSPSVPTKAITVRSLSPQRDYLEVRDAARAFVDLAVSNASGIFNVGTGRAASVADLISIIAKEVGQNLEKEESEHIRTSSRLSLETKKIRTVTGWIPIISLEQGLHDLIKTWRAGV